MSGINLIVGLGNPGAQYLRNRHNAGFWFADALAQAHGGCFRGDSKLHGQSCRITVAKRLVWLLKPSTFMNESGVAVAAALRYYKIEPQQCLVVHDDLDLNAGVVRLKFDGGHGGQNGLRDIFAHVGHGRFHRLRIGIGHPGHRDRVTPWVLGQPSAQDESAMLDAIARGFEVLPLAVEGRFDEAMKALHSQRTEDGGQMTDV